ncbi:MAG TPA: rhomboid family intramembrane serine protease [Chryseolinea sp.]|nr:rhomboid family intramembrane serine protease [Chryseolinea sp.]
MNRYISTLVIIGINIIVFAFIAIQQQSLMMTRNIDVLAILHAGGNLNPFTMDGEQWRVISSMFLHFGVIHLLANMVGLYFLGSTLEPTVGTSRFLLIYFFCGIAAGIASLLFNFYTISAGASGAIFGLFGYRLGTELIQDSDDRKKLIALAIGFIGFVIVNALIATSISVDIAGHLGGIIAGIIIAVLQYRFQLLVANWTLASAVVILFLITFALPKDLLNYYSVFKRVLLAERRTNGFYQNSMNDAQLVDSLTVITKEWDSIHHVLRSIPAIREELRTDTAILAEYIKLQKQDAIYRTALIHRESYVYLDSMEVVSTKMDSLPKFQYNLNFSMPESAPVLDEESTEPRPTLETRRVFYDEEWKEINDPSLAAYYRIGTVDSLGRFQGVVRDYYRNGDVQMKGKYLDGMKDGIFLYYTNRKTYSSAGRYAKEDPVGKWENYHWNGTLESEVYYNDEIFTRNTWDSLGRQQVVNGKGNCIRWHSNGNVSEEGSYDGGKKTGNWYGYHDDGTPYFREFYRSNRLVHGVSETKNGRRYVYDHLSQYAVPVVGMPEFNKYLVKSIQRPASTEMRTGTVKVVFNVGNDGSVWDFVIVEGLSKAYDQEAIRLIKDGPAWRPGVLHGHEQIPSQGYVEVIF